MKNDTILILEDSHFYVGSCKYLFKNDIILSVELFDNDKLLII